MLVMVVFFIAFRWIHLSTPLIRLFLLVLILLLMPTLNFLRSEERFSRNAETDLVCRLLLEKKKIDMDPLFKGNSAEWIVKTAEQFYVTMGFPPLPASFWQKSNFYP